MFTRALVLVFAALSLSACNISGSVQKGPFKAGSNVSISKLDKQAAVIPSRKVDTQVVGNNGYYSANTINWNGWTEVQITGQYFNEYSGSDSNEALTLNAITKKDRRFDKANVNLFTHFAAARIRQKVAEGDNRNKAWKNTQKELKQLFGLKKVTKNIHQGVEKLSLLRGNGKYRKDNANLLLFTGSFLATGGSAENLQTLTDDFADDALFNGAGANLFNTIAIKAGEANLLSSLSQNLKNHGTRNPPNNGDMPQLPLWVIEDSGEPDTTPPVISITNGSPITVDFESTYVDAGATATDNIDEVVTAEIISNNVDTSVAEGSFNVVYKSTDSSGNSSTATRVVNIGPAPVVNTPPVADSQNDLTLDEDGNLEITLTGSDVDEADTLTYSIKTPPTNGSLSPLNGSTLTYTPNSNYFGPDSFEFQINDGSDLSNIATVTLVVNSINDLPTANAGDDVSLEADNTVTLTGTATDVEGISSYAWYIGDSEVAVASTASFDFLATDAGTYTLTFVATDTNNATASDELVVTVTAPPVEESIIQGRVFKADGSAITGATVSKYKNGELVLDDTLIITEADGSFSVTLNTDEEVTLTFEADGFATQVLPVKSPKIANASVDIDVMMIARGAPQTMSGPTVISKTGADGASVVVAPNSFVDQNGIAVEDNIIVTITPIDISTPAGVASFPGEFSGIAENNASKTPIISYGTVEYNFVRESTGEKVQLADGQQATIFIPMYKTEKQEGGNYVPGDTIALWSLNESTGIWRQEGTGTVVRKPDDGAGTGLFLRAIVSHFTWWNCDVTMNPAKASITVLGESEGTALIQARTTGNIGSSRPSTVDTLVNVGETTTPALNVPSNGKTCFWAEINFIDGTSGTTSEQCFTPAAGEAFNVLLSLSTVDLAISTTPASSSPITGFINFPVNLIKIRPLTIETDVTYAITTGTLPAGISMNPINTTEAVISGTPTEAGNFTIEITGTDSDGNTSTQSLTYAISSDVLLPPHATGTLEVDIDLSLEAGFDNIGRYLLYHFDGGEPDTYTFVTSAAHGCNALPQPHIYLRASSSPNPDFSGKMIFWVGSFEDVSPNSDTKYCIKMENAAGSDILVARVIRGSVNAGPGTFTDPISGMMIQDDAASSNNNLNWNDAKNYCANLILAGYSDWRLPNNADANEIVDRGDYKHPFGNDDLQNMNNTQPFGRSYWTSVSLNATYARGIFIDDGTVLGGLAKTSIFATRCVRN